MPKMFEYTQQLDHLKVKLEDIPDILDSYDSIKKWLIITHDKDKDTAKHIHIMGNLGNTNKSFKDIAGWFKDEPQYVQSIKCGKWNRAALYLIHRGNKEKEEGKYQYDIEELRGNYDFMSDIEKAQKNEENKQKYMSLEDYCCKVITGEILPNCPEKYLNDFDCINDKGLIKKAYNERVRRMVNNRKMNRDMDVKVIFITGPAGCGKDFFAIELASGFGDGSYCISSSSNDAVQDYNGENTLILSDLRDDAYSLQDLLKILDNHLPTSIKSRYNNKYFIGNYIIITSSVDLPEWYKGYYSNDKEDMNQLIRRIGLYVKINPDNGTIKQYNLITAEEYHRRYMFDDSAECINIFPAGYSSKSRYYYNCVYSSPYSQLQTLIDMKQAIKEKNMPNLLNCLDKSLGHLQQDVKNINEMYQRGEIEFKDGK